MLHLQADKLHLSLLCGLPFCADRLPAYSRSYGVFHWMAV